MELQYRQELTINPRLYQAMDLLQMPLLDLQMHLKQELMVNPFLELAEESEEEQDPSAEDAGEDDRPKGADGSRARSKPRMRKTPRGQNESESAELDTVEAGDCRRKSQYDDLARRMAT